MRVDIVNKKVKQYVLLLALLIIFSLNPAVAQQDGKEKLVFGIFPYMNGSRILKQFMPLADYLARVLNRPVQIVSAPSFKEFVVRSDSQNYDLIFTAPHFAVYAENNRSYERIFRFDNKLSAVIFTDIKSSISSVSDLNGKTIASPDKLAVVNVLGEVFLKREGVLPELINLPSHNNVILSVTNGRYQAGIVAKPVFKDFDKKNPGSLRVITETEAVPGAMFMLKSNLPHDVKSSIEQAFAAFEKSSDGNLFFSKTAFGGLKRISDQEMQQMKSYLEIVEGHL